MFFKQIALLLFAVALSMGYTSHAAVIEARTAANATTAVPATHIGPKPEIIFPNYNAIIAWTGQSCSGSYSIVELAEMSPYVCTYPSVFYESIEVYTPTGAGLNVGIYAALENCAEPTFLQHVNTCYNVFFNGQPYPFASFYET